MPSITIDYAAVKAQNAQMVERIKASVNTYQTSNRKTEYLENRYIYLSMVSFFIRGLYAIIFLLFVIALFYHSQTRGGATADYLPYFVLMILFAVWPFEFSYNFITTWVSYLWSRLSPLFTLSRAE